MTLGESSGEGAEEAVLSVKATMEGDFDSHLAKLYSIASTRVCSFSVLDGSDALKTFLVDNGAGKKSPILAVRSSAIRIVSEIF